MCSIWLGAKAGKAQNFICIAEGKWKLFNSLCQFSVSHCSGYVLTRMNRSDIEWAKLKSFYNSFCFHKNLQEWVPDKRRTTTAKENLFAFEYVFNKDTLTFHFEITLLIDFILVCVFENIWNQRTIAFMIKKNILFS